MYVAYSDLAMYFCLGMVLICVIEVFMVNLYVRMVAEATYMVLMCHRFCLKCLECGSSIVLAMLLATFSKKLE